MVCCFRNKPFYVIRFFSVSILENEIPIITQPKPSLCYQANSKFVWYACNDISRAIDLVITTEYRIHTEERRTLETARAQTQTKWEKEIDFETKTENRKNKRNRTLVHTENQMKFVKYVSNQNQLNRKTQNEKK